MVGLAGEGSGASGIEDDDKSIDDDDDYSIDEEVPEWP
jgi:hypothetical protein